MAALALSCSRHASVTDLERYQLTGDVLCARVDLGGGRSYTAWFNRRGMLDSLVQCTPTETLSNVYYYDSRGRLTEHAIYRADRHYEGYYLYDYKGDVVRDCRLFGWDLQAIFEWQYDVRRGRQEHCRYYNEGALVSTTDYHYGKNTKMESVRDASGEPCGEMTYRMLDDFRILSIEGEDIHINVEYSSDMLPSSSNGCLVEADSEISSNSEIRTHGSVKYFYEKDLAGNWISRTETYGINGVAGRTITRTITYRE